MSIHETIQCHKSKNKVSKTQFFNGEILLIWAMTKVFSLIFSFPINLGHESMKIQKKKTARSGTSVLGASCIQP